MSRPRPLAAALAAVAAGTVCIVLGRAALAEPARLAAARAALVAPNPVAPAVASGGVGSALVGSGDDRAALRAAADLLGARTIPAATRAEAELATLAASGPGDRRSWAATLAALVELRQAQLGGRTAQRHVANATAALQSAVAADPANENAKRDLELLLTLQQRSRKQQSQRQHSSRGHLVRPQAGHQSPGWGW